MKNVSQDIYGTDRRKPEFEPASDMERAELLNRPWADAVQRQRRSTLILTLVSALIIVLVGTVAIQQYLLLNRRSPARDVPQPTPRKLVSPTTLELDAQTQFLMDELTEQQAMAIPEKGDMPLNSTWVKQAAYHLLQADKASREEQFADALTAYREALLIFPALKGVQRQMGLIQLRMKDYKAAAESFEKVLTQEEPTFGVANNLGVSYLALETYNKAEANFLLASKLNPQYPLAYFNLATLYVRTGDLARASTYFGKYLMLRPDDVDAAQTYAMVLLQLKQWDRAVTLLDQIGRAAPDVAPIQFRLAEALSHTDKRAAALDALKRGATLVDPRKALAWMSQPEFDLLRNDPGFRQLRDELGASD
ncbi:MAG: tetratricopeptide repeat protein [Verrucomicrobiota bacterium]